MQPSPRLGRLRGNSLQTFDSSLRVKETTDVIIPSHEEEIISQEMILEETTKRGGRQDEIKR